MERIDFYHKEHLVPECLCAFCIVNRAVIKQLKELGFEVVLHSFKCDWSKYKPSWTHFDFMIEFHGKTFGDIIFELDPPSIGMREFVDDYFDYILCASSFIKNAWKKEGVDEKRLILMGEGIDTDIFNIDQTAMTILPDKFKFLTCGAWQSSDAPDRKGFLRLIRIFKEEFTGRDDIVLIIKTRGSPVDADFGKNVVLIPNDLPVLELAQLYRACAKDGAFIHLHKAEGFSRPSLEMLHCGARIGTTGYSGPLDFLNSKNATLFDYKLVEVAETKGVWEGSWNKKPVWAEVNEDDVRKWMHEVVETKKENPHYAKKDEHTWVGVVDNLLIEMRKRL